RHGRVLEIDAARQQFLMTLKGSGKALSALRDCVQQVFGPSGPGASPAQPSANQARAPEQPTAPVPSEPDAAVERVISAAKQLRMGRLIFPNDAAAEPELRSQLHSALVSVPDDQRDRQGALVLQAFFVHRVEQAMKTAPADVIAKMIRHDRDVMQ